MYKPRRLLSLGLAAGAMALAAGLAGADAFAPVGQLLKSEEFCSFVLYLETGRIVRFSPSLEETANFAGESPPPAQAPQPVLPVYLPEDAARVKLFNSSGIHPDVQTLLTQPLSWKLTGGGPKVLILHTHATESYTKNGESYVESSPYRTLDESYNMLSVGDRVARQLEAAGIGVIHDRTLHDYPSYNGSYTHARGSIADILAENPEICLVLDLHRDASGEDQQQFRPCATVQGSSCAQLMLVMGTDASGQSHPNWRQNLALALKLQLQLEALAPGITRPLYLRSQRFNQDMTPGSLLVEVGAAGNTHAEALRAADILAEAVIALASGT